MRERLIQDDGQFPGCEEGSHQFVMTEQCGDYDYYTCRKCGKEIIVPIPKTMTMPLIPGGLEKDNSEYVILKPEKTAPLFSDTLKLYMCQSGKTVKIRKPRIEVGRGKDCDLWLNDTCVSRKQATFFYENQSWFLQDNHATNGTYVNGVKLQPMKKHQLDANDLIGFAGKNVEMVFFRTERTIKPATEAPVKKKLNPGPATEDFSEARSDNDPWENRLIADKYRILKRISRSSPGKVYLAMNEQINQVYTVKMCGKAGRDSLLHEYLLNEARAMKELKHPAVPQIHEILEDKSETYVIREYIQGETLDAIVQKQGVQPESRVLDWAKQLCDVLGYLHGLNPPYIYADMKPGNVLLRPDGQVSLINFETIRLYAEKENHNTAALWERGYTAPEQYGKGGQTDVRTDIFGLGMTMRYLITGVDLIHSPASTQSIRTIAPECPAPLLEPIIQKCIETDPEKRYQTVEALLTDLNREPADTGKKGLFSKMFDKH